MYFECEKCEMFPCRCPRTVHGREYGFAGIVIDFHFHNEGSRKEEDNNKFPRTYGVKIKRIIP